MKIPFYGLRTGILTQLIFLIIAAMLLINVAMVKFAERDLVQAKARTGRLLIQALEQNVNHLMRRKIPLKEVGYDPLFNKYVRQLLLGGGFKELIIIDQKGIPVFTSGFSSGAEKRGLSNAREAMQTGGWSTDFYGSTWGVLWLNNKDIRISAPLKIKDRSSGGIVISASLDPIYRSLRNSEKIIFLYIILDTVILAIAGIYLLSRIAVKPIHKLLKMTEEYKEGDIIPPLSETPRNEIGELSRSLNYMLKRLDENKKELKAHIVSLEKANRELQQAQDEILRSEKLASVGRLAAGIAHEIGNPITVILGYLGLIRKGDILNDEKEDFLNRIESEITRIHWIIRQLLDFSRPSSGKPERTCAHEILMNITEIMRPQPMMEDIAIIFQLEASDDEVFADPNQLQQVFLNIMMNAADFFAEKNLPEDQERKKEISIKSRNIGESIELRIADKGPGIPDKDLDHIFDPFYTTKEPGKGTGLGLSVCYRIVEGLGGTIKAESAVGVGTTLTITLPLYGRKT